VNSKDQTTKEIIALKQKVPFDFLEAGIRLEWVRKHYGKHDMLDVAEASEIDERAAYYFIELAEHFYSLDQRERLLKIGWTKLKAIRPYLRNRDLETLLNAAETHSEKNLIAGLKGKPAVERVWNLNWTMEQMAVINHAVVMIGGKNKAGDWLMSKEDALVQIAKLAMKALKSGPSDTPLAGAA